MNRRTLVPNIALALLLGFAGTGAIAGEPLGNATVSFGSWMSSPPLDRWPNFGGSPTTNVHEMTPNVVTIKAGGSVNFIVSGLHNIAVRGKPADAIVSRTTRNSVI